MNHGIGRREAPITPCAVNRTGKDMECICVVSHIHGKQIRAGGKNLALMSKGEGCTRPPLGLCKIREERPRNLLMISCTARTRTIETDILGPESVLFALLRRHAISDSHAIWSPHSHETTRAPHPAPFPRLGLGVLVPGTRPPMGASTRNT